MIELVSSAAEKAVPTAPLLELGGDGWTLGAETTCFGTFGLEDPRDMAPLPGDIYIYYHIFLYLYIYMICIYIFIDKIHKACK